MRRCSLATHERMKRDPVLFLRCRYIGIQRLDGMQPCMLRNCPRCDGTLSVSKAALLEMYPMPIGVGDWVAAQLA